MWKQKVSWAGQANTEMWLTREHPLAATNTVALKLITAEGGGGVTNTGFWGIPAGDGKAYAFSFYAVNQASSAQQVRASSLVMSLASKLICEETAFIMYQVRSCPLVCQSSSACKAPSGRRDTRTKASCEAIPVWRPLLVKSITDGLP